jgi:hypothetical protein
VGVDRKFCVAFQKDKNSSGRLLLLKQQGVVRIIDGHNDREEIL